MISQEQTFFSGLKELAKVCKCELSEWSMEAYLAAFQQVGFTKGIEALKMAFMKARAGYMPAPMDLLALVGIKPPEAPSARDEGVDFTCKVVQLMSSHGRYRSKEVREILGEDIWGIIEGFGGWDNVCDTELDNLPTVRAQMRDAYESRKKISYHRDQGMISGTAQGYLDQMRSVVTSADHSTQPSQREA